jgi:hypothetical protein
MKVAGKDFWAGLLFIAFGLGFMIVSRNYPMGTSVRMGPAYFPTMLGGLLAVLGAIILFRAFFSKDKTSLKVFEFRPWVLVAGIIVGIIAYFSIPLRSMGAMGEAGYLVIGGSALLLVFGAFGPKLLWMILGASLAFGYLLKPLGMVLSTIVLVFFSAYAGHEFRVKEVLVLSIALAAFGVGVFIYGLGLPMNIWPAVFGG